MVPRLAERFMESSEEECMSMADLVSTRRSICLLIINLDTWYVQDTEGCVLCKVRRHQKYQRCRVRLDNTWRYSVRPSSFAERQVKQRLSPQRYWGTSLPRGSRLERSRVSFADVIQGGTKTLQSTHRAGEWWNSSVRRSVANICVCQWELRSWGSVEWAFQEQATTMGKSNYCLYIPPSRSLSSYIRQTFKHIFTSPSSVDKEVKATRSGNARIHGMTRVTTGSISYAATQVHPLTHHQPTIDCLDPATFRVVVIIRVLQVGYIDRLRKILCQCVGFLRRSGGEGRSEQSSGLVEFVSPLQYYHIVAVLTVLGRCFRPMYNGNVQWLKIAHLPDWRRRGQKCERQGAGLVDLAGLSSVVVF